MTFTESFQILGLSKEADASDIKKAYRKKAMALHPDKNASPSAEQDFIRLNKAYEKALIYVDNKDNLHAYLYESYAKKAQQDAARKARAQHAQRVKKTHTKKTAGHNSFKFKYGVFTEIFKSRKYERFIATLIMSVVLSLAFTIDMHTPPVEIVESIVAYREVLSNEVNNLERTRSYFVEGEYNTIEISDSLYMLVKGSHLYRKYHTRVFERTLKVRFYSADGTQYDKLFSDKAYLYWVFVSLFLIPFLGFSISERRKKVGVFFRFYTTKVLPYILVASIVIMHFV